MTKDKLREIRDKLLEERRPEDTYVEGILDMFNFIFRELSDNPNR